MIVSDQKRLDYLDLLKGFAIFLVVMGHFLGWTFPSDVERTGFSVFVEDAIYSFHMPLFFFVSGYLVDLREKEWSLRTGVTVMRKKVVALLLPGFSFLLLLYARTGVIYFEWFLKVLFEMYLVYVVTRLSSRYLFDKVPVEMALHIVAIALLFVMKPIVNGTVLHDVLLYSSLCSSYPYFVLGYVFCRFGLNRFVISNDWIYTIGIVVWGVLFLWLGNLEFPGKKYIVALSAIIVCLKMALSVDFSKPSLLKNSLIRWGKISLAIYLVSPMIIPWFPELGMYFIKADSYEPFGNVTHSMHMTTIFLQIVSGVAISVYVCVACSIIKKIVQKSSFLNFVLFGEKKSDALKKYT